MSDRDCVYSKEKKYFVYDQDGGMLFFKTKEEAHKYSKEAIQSYQDGNLWIEGVDLIISGEITHKVEETDVMCRPEDSELDEDVCDEDGVYWDYHEKMRSYELKKIEY